MITLGLHAWTHDSAVCLVRDGTPIAWGEEERFSRVKNTGAFPAAALTSALGDAGIAPGEIDRVVIPFRPQVGAARRLAYLARRPLSLLQKGPDLIRKGMGVRTAASHLKSLGITAPVTFADHYLAHALASFCSSSFHSALVLVLDGVAEAWSGALYQARRSPHPSLRLMKKFPFPNSLGLLYAAVTEHLGFRHNRDEGRVMAMAALGDGRFLPSMRRVVRYDNGAFMLQGNLFDFGARWTTPSFARLFCPRRKPDEPLDENHMALAYACQGIVEEVAVQLARFYLEKSGENNIVFTGGLALNPRLNGRLLRECCNLFLLPAGGDAGTALGAALLPEPSSGWHLDNPYLGRLCSEREMEEALGKTPFPVQVEAGSPERIAKRLAEGEIGGLFRGRAEIGPRALGHRSILADPRDSRMKERLNRIKGREPFRPFAPAVIAERRPDLFPEVTASPFMLLTFPLPPVAAETIPAVVHADGTSRVQTVAEDDTSGLYPILAAFEALTGLPVLLNTSLNLKNEPLVNTPREALDLYARADLDFLVLGERIVTRA